MVDATDSHHGVFADVAIRFASVRRDMPAGHLALPRFRDVAKLAMVAGAVDGLFGCMVPKP